MSTQALFDPAFIALVREVATDPNSTLLRVPRRPRLVELARPSVVGNHSALLTRAERELVRTHREALAALLIEAAKQRVYPGTEVDVRRRFTRIVTRERTLEMLDERGWRQLAQRELANYDSEPLDFAADLVRQCLAPDRSGDVSIVQLAVAAERLVPTHRARIYAGVGLIFDGQLNAAIRVLSQVVAESATRIDLAYAHMNVAYAHSENGRWQAAFEAHRECQRASAEVELCPINLLILGILAGRAEDLRALARDVEARFGVDHPLVEMLASSHATRVHSGLLEVPPEASRVARRCLESASGSARRITDALL